MAEAYEIDGKDLADYLTHLQVVDGFLGVPQYRQQDIDVPGRWGAVATAPWPGARTLTLGGVVTGSTRAEYLENLRAFGGLVVNDGRTFTLTKTYDTTDSRTLTVASTARYSAGLETVEQITPRAGRVAVEFRLMDGYWLSPASIDSGPITASAFALEIPGDVTTHRMQVVFSGTASTSRLTNTTTGGWIEFASTTATYAATLDVWEFTAKRNSVNVLSSVNYSQPDKVRYWFGLRPGVNQFTLSGGGTVRLYYRGAFL